MSYAQGTQFYNLPQTVGTDKRDWFDTNEAFRQIDAALHAAAVGQAGDAEAITAINTRLAADEENIAELQSTTSTHSTQVAALNTAVNENTADIADVRQDCEDMITAYNEGSAATSTRAYKVGDYFIYNDVLYRAKNAIAIGDTIVPNNNCVATNVGTEVSALNSDLPKYSLIDINHSQTLTTADGTKTVSQLLQDAISNFRNLTIPSGYAWQIKEVIVPTSTTGRTTYNVHEGIRTSISETANIQGDAILRGSTSVSMATISLATPFCSSAYINSNNSVGYSDALSNTPNSGLKVEIRYDLYKVN